MSGVCGLFVYRRGQGTMSDSTGQDAGIGKYYPLLLIITIKINSFTEEVSDVNI